MLVHRVWTRYGPAEAHVLHTDTQCGNRQSRLDNHTVPVHLDGDGPLGANFVQQHHLSSQRSAKGSGR